MERNPLVTPLLLKINFLQAKIHHVCVTTGPRGDQRTFYSALPGWVWGTSSQVRRFWVQTPDQTAERFRGYNSAHKAHLWLWFSQTC